MWTLTCTCVSASAFKGEIRRRMAATHQCDGVRWAVVDRQLQRRAPPHDRHGVPVAVVDGAAAARQTSGASGYAALHATNASNQLKSATQQMKRKLQHARTRTNNRGCATNGRDRAARGRVSVLGVSHFLMVSPWHRWSERTSVRACMREPIRAHMRECIATGGVCMHAIVLTDTVFCMPAKIQAHWAYVVTAPRFLVATVGAEEHAAVQPGCP